MQATLLLAVVGLGRLGQGIGALDGSDQLAPPGCLKEVAELGSVRVDDLNLKPNAPLGLERPGGIHVLRHGGGVGAAAAHRGKRCVCGPAAD